MPTSRRDLLTAPLKREERLKLERFGIAPDLAQFQPGTGDKSSGRTVLPTNNDTIQEATTMTQPTAGYENSTQTPSSGAEFERDIARAQHSMAADMRAMREADEKARSARSVTIRTVSILAGAWAVITLAGLTVNALTKPKAAPVPTPGDVVGLKK